MKRYFQKLVFILVTVLPFSSYSQEENFKESQAKIPLSYIYKKILPATTLLDVPYGSDVQQTYDIYLPAGRAVSRTKVIILIHGGSWRSGDKKSMEHYVLSLQQSNPNHAIVNMNYVTNLTGGNYAFPNQFLNIKTLINSLKNHRLDYNIDCEFGLVGGSAGGHLALMFDSLYDEADEVKFVCSIAGPTNFNHPVYINRPDFKELLDLLVDRNVYPNIENNLDVLSPAHQITQFSSPTLLFYGSRDPKVPISGALLEKRNLMKEGIEHNLTIFQGGHGDWDDADYKKLYTDLGNFIDVHLPI